MIELYVRINEGVTGHIIYLSEECKDIIKIPYIFRPVRNTFGRV